MTRRTSRIEPAASAVLTLLVMTGAALEVLMGREGFGKLVPEAIAACIEGVKLHPRYAIDFMRLRAGNLLRADAGTLLLHLRDILAGMLMEASAAGEMNLTCARTASEDLLGLWLGFSAIERRFLCTASQHDVLSARVDRGVDLFIRANAA